MKVRLVAYDLEALEYTTWGRSPQTFGTPTEILSRLHEWAERAEFAETGLEYLTQGKSYCYSTHRSSHGHLLVLWHENATFDDFMLYARRSSEVGNVPVTKKRNPPGTIPGLPAHFWFPTTAGRVCAVHLAKRPASMGKLRSYLKAYMYHRCDLVVRTTHETGREATLKGPLDEDGRAVRATVGASPSRTSDSGNLVGQLGEIRAIIRKERIAGKPRRMGSVARMLGLGEDDHLNATVVRQTVEVPHGMNRRLFNSIVEHYSERGDKDLDFGFKVKDQGTQWLSSRKIVSRHDLDVGEKDGVVSDVGQLARELAAREDQILAGENS